jgi:fermentation-respiration switch protein FrsA (DUF1100 family)
VRKVRRLRPYLAVSTLVLALVGYGAVSVRVADGLTKLERRALEPPASAVAAAHEDVSFKASDGVTLKGWWFSGVAQTFGSPITSARPVDRAVVFVHGRGANRIASGFKVDKIAPIFLARGWNVLLFDLRGHGESGGERYSLGQYEPRDIVAAVELAAAKTNIPKARVAVIGESLGAGSAIMTVAVDPSIGPVVADSAYADGYTVVSEVGPNYSGLPGMFTPGIAIASRVFFGLDVWSVRPADVVRAHPERAWLFIQCTTDGTVYAHHGADLKAASANKDTELWMVEGCEHVKAFSDHPVEWQQRVLAFLDREIAKAPAATSR